MLISNQPHPLPYQMQESLNVMGDTLTCDTCLWTLAVEPLRTACSKVFHGSTELTTSTYSRQKERYKKGKLTNGHSCYACTLKHHLTWSLVNTHLPRMRDGYKQSTRLSLPTKSLVTSIQPISICTTLPKTYYSESSEIGTQYYNRRH